MPERPPVVNPAALCFNPPMHPLLRPGTLMLMLSAAVVAALSVLPETSHIPPFWIVHAGLKIADTLFHELGHTLFAWFFGIPAIPMLFTLFGADQAGGMSMQLAGWSWIMQLVALVIMGYGCYRLREAYESLFIPAALFTVAIAAAGFTGYHQQIIGYMGHGGSILMGGYLLFRGWTYLDARGGFERWLNGLFGFFLVFVNMRFSYRLIYDEATRERYGNTAFGVSHNDFLALADMVPGWTVEGVAMFTIGFGAATILAAFILAWRFENRVAPRGF